MSTFVVDDETINKVVSYLYAKAVGEDTSVVSRGLVKMGFDLSKTLHVERLANAMFDLNVAAVKERYRGFSLPTFTYLFTPASEIEVIKALESWSYQCREGRIPASELYKAMAQTLCLLCIDYVHYTEEYEAATWG